MSITTSDGKQWQVVADAVDIELSALRLENARLAAVASAAAPVAALGTMELPAGYTMVRSTLLGELRRVMLENGLRVTA